MGDSERARPGSIEDLGRPAAWADVASVGRIETHVSVLFFAGERVYKVKKPVDLGFLDFTTLERRRYFCEEEVRLNARLAPGVCLGVVPITAGPDGRLRVGGAPDDAVEWAVEMRRLPAHRMLAALLEHGAVDNAEMNGLAELLAGFHADAATGEGVDEHGSPAAIRADIEQNFEQLAPFTAQPGERSESGVSVLTPAQLAFLRERADAFLRERAPLLEERVRRGRIREGHGDLHADNICYLERGPIVYDRIEFSKHLRCTDVACDLAFLAMDVEHRGFPAFAGYLVKRYAALSGDEALRELMGFYKGYRAIVRAKVAALTASDPMRGEERARALAAEARSYVHLAVSYELPAVLLLLCGLPAAGKSWLSPALAAPLRATELSSDTRRKVLAGLRPDERASAAVDTGLYTPEARRRTYRSLLDDTVSALRSGRSVVVDATFTRREQRTPFVDAAARLGVPFVLCHLQADERAVRERLAARAADPRAVSDAGWEVYLRARASFEPPDELPAEGVLALRSAGTTREELAALVFDRLIARSRAAAG